MLIELFLYCLFIVLADNELDADENSYHESCGNAENYEYVLDEAREQIADSRNARNGESVGQLGRYVVNVVALCAS